MILSQSVENVFLRSSDFVLDKITLFLKIFMITFLFEGKSLNFIASRISWVNHQCVIFDFTRR